MGAWIIEARSEKSAKINFMEEGSSRSIIAKLGVAILVIALIDLFFLNYWVLKSGKLKVESGKPERHGRWNLRARRETVQGAAGQRGHDVRVVDGEGEVGMRIQQEVV